MPPSSPPYPSFRCSCVSIRSGAEPGPRPLSDEEPPPLLLSSSCEEGTKNEGQLKRSKEREKKERSTSSRSLTNKQTNKWTHRPLECFEGITRRFWGKRTHFVSQSLISEKKSQKKKKEKNRTSWETRILPVHRCSSRSFHLSSPSLL